MTEFPLTQAICPIPNTAQAGGESSPDRTGHQTRCAPVPSGAPHRYAPPARWCAHPVRTVRCGTEQVRTAAGRQDGMTTRRPVVWMRGGGSQAAVRLTCHGEFVIHPW